MNGIDIFEAQFRAMLLDINHYWYVGVWRFRCVRWAILVVVLALSFLYCLTSIFYLVAGLWSNIGLALQLFGIAGISGWLMLWSIGAAVREVRK